MTLHGILLYCCHALSSAFSCYLDVLAKLLKKVCRTVNLSLALSLKALVHCPNLVTLSLCYKQYFEQKCHSAIFLSISIFFYEVSKSAESNSFISSQNWFVGDKNQPKDVYLLDYSIFNMTRHIAFFFTLDYVQTGITTVFSFHKNIYVDGKTEKLIQEPQKKTLRSYIYIYIYVYKKPKM